MVLTISNALTFEGCGSAGQSDCTDSHVPDLRRLKQTLWMVLSYLVSSASLFDPFNVIFAQRANLILRLFIPSFIVGGVHHRLQATSVPGRMPYRRICITDLPAGFDAPLLYQSDGT